VLDPEYFVDPRRRRYFETGPCERVVFLNFRGAQYEYAPHINWWAEPHPPSELSVWTDSSLAARCELRSRIWCPSFKEVGRD